MKYNSKRIILIPYHHLPGIEIIDDKTENKTTNFVVSVGNYIKRSLSNLDNFQLSTVIVNLDGKQLCNLHLATEINTIGFGIMLIEILTTKVQQNYRGNTILQQNN